MPTLREPKSPDRIIREADRASTAVGRDILGAVAREALLHTQVPSDGVPGSVLNQEFPLRTGLLRLTLGALRALEKEHGLTLDDDRLKELFREKIGELLTSEKLAETGRRITAADKLQEFRQALWEGRTDVKLYEHQKEVFDSLAHFLEQGVERGWIKLPTGSGKTAIFCSLAQALGLKTLVLVPREKLVEQTVTAMGRFAPELKPTEFWGDVKDTSGDVVVSTYQSLGTLLDRAQLEGRKWDLVICDEGHRALTPITQSRLSRIPGALWKLALTATPEFHAGKSVANEFGECIHRMDIVHGIRGDILSGARVVAVRTKVDLSTVKRTVEGDFQEGDLQRAVDTATRNAAMFEILKTDICKGKSAVAFGCSISHLEHLEAQAENHGITARAIHGSMSKKEQKEILAAYERGDIQLLLTVDLLKEGWDSPRTQLAFMLRPTNSAVDAEQRLGRALRKWLEGKKDYALIFEFFDLGPDGNGRDLGITASHVLGGAVCMPEKVEGDFQRDLGEEGRRSLQNLKLGDGISIEVDTEVIEEIVSRRPADDRRAGFTSIDEMREVLAQNGVTSADSLENRSLSSFLSIPIESDIYSGSVWGLVRRYYSDIAGESLPRSRAAAARGFLAAMFGAEGEQALVNDLAGKSSLNDLGRLMFTMQHADPSELLAAPVVAGTRASKVLMTGDDLLRGLASAERIIYPEQLDEAGFRSLAEKSLPKKEYLEFLAQREERERIVTLQRRGTLENVIAAAISDEAPTIEEFRKLTVVSEDGVRVSGAGLLNFYKIKTAEEYLLMLEDLKGERFIESQTTSTIERIQSDSSVEIESHVVGLVSRGARADYVQYLESIQHLPIREWQVQGAMYGSIRYPVRAAEAIAGISSKIQGSFDATEDGLARLARAILKPDDAEKYLVERKERQIVAGLRAGGTLEETVAQARQLLYMLPASIEQTQIQAPNGATFSCGTVRAFVAPTSPKLAHIGPNPDEFRTRYVSFLRRFFTDDVIQGAVTEMRSALREYIKSKPEGPYLSRDAIAKLELPLASGVIAQVGVVLCHDGMPGLETGGLRTVKGQVTAHQEFKTWVDGLVGEEGFYKAFHFGDRTLLREITRLSLKGRIGNGGGSPKEIAQVPIAADAPLDPALKPSVRTVGELALAWFNAKNQIESARARASRVQEEGGKDEVRPRAQDIIPDFFKFLNSQDS